MNNIDISKFTNDQAAGYTYLTGELLASKSLLNGAAGTGKTTLITHVVKEWLAQGKTVHMTALTHKAATVVREMLSDNGMSVKVSTIHSALGLVLNVNKATGQSKLKATGNPKVAFNSIVTVDEASMANDEMVEHIEHTRKTLNLTIVYIADSNQLPPVASVDKKDIGLIRLSPIFEDDSIRKVTLTETVRQPGASPIVDLARNFITSHTMPSMDRVIENEHGRVELMNHGDLLERAKTLALEAHESKDPKFMIVLAHKNAAVVTYNNKLRAHVWGNAEPFRPDERFIVNEQSKGRDINGAVCEMFNNEEIAVKSSVLDQQYGVDGYRIVTMDDRECFAATDPLSLIGLKKAFAREKKWPEFFGLRERVVDLRPTYAVTVHKSQSSTFRHVLIDMGDIHSGNDNLMLQKLCYTAMTRASKSVSMAGFEVYWPQESSSLAMFAS